MAEVSMKVLTPIFHFTAFNTSLPLPIHPNELHLKNGGIVMLSKLQEHSYVWRLSHPNSGLLHAITLSTSSIVFQPLTSIINAHSKDYLENHLIITPYEFLVVYVIHG